jgi:hypothetical protein
MQPIHKTIFAACSVALMLASTSTPAVTLGRLRGSVLVGKGLDVSVNVQFAADEDGSATCFDADVNYGETPLERSRISIQTQPGPQANSQIVRISSPAKVNEAVVSVNLKVACGPKAARHYVLLSDVLSETLASGSEANPPNMSAPERSQPAVALPVAPVPATAQSATPAQTRPAPVSKKTPAGARLKLAPLANGSASDAAVAAGKPVNSAALDELQRRVEVIEKAQAGNASAEQSLQNGVRAKALEADIESLRIATAKNQKNLQTMLVALEGTPTQDFGRSLVYLLGVLLVACLAALAYIVLRLRNGGFDAAPWWSGGEDRFTAAAKATAPATAPVPVVPASGVPTSPVHLAEPSAVAFANRGGPSTVQSQPVDLDTDTTRSTVVMDVRPVQPFIDAMTSISPRANHLDFAPSNTGTIKAINTKEMLDVRQQAEFFMALGQHDDAVRLLETNIRESVDANPLVFLDLLRILHTLSRRSDFERYREEFNLQFTGRILDYANFLSEGNGLDAYEDICQQIVVLWPTEYTIDFIEQCLVRTPEDDPEQGIDLEAFKDLLLLYGVLRRLEQVDDSAYLPFSTSRTANATPVAFSAGFAAGKAEEGSSPPLPVIDPDSQPADIDLDIDLDLDVDLDIDLDVGVDAAKADKKPNNLIDFDMSGYVKPSPDKPPKS